MNPMDEAYRLCDELPTHRTLDLETVLVAGASGYIGGRLVPELVARGYRVRVMVRRIAKWWWRMR
jgi:nucleoside-diphosphate-sugar epimerase